MVKADKRASWDVEMGLLEPGGLRCRWDSLGIPGRARESHRFKLPFLDAAATAVFCFARALLLCSGHALAAAAR